MKCPKCGYLGFETGDRCRNCGYDFSLAVPVAEAARELPLNVRDGSVAPMADLDLTGPEMRDHRRALDLDRLIGGNPTPTDMTVKVDERRGSPTLVTNTVASGAPPVASAPPAVRQAVTSTSRGGLPLFAPPSTEADDTPLITKPRPVRPPLSVRRATPDVPRLRPRPFRPRSDESPLSLQTDDIDRIPDGDDEAGMDVVEPLRKTLPNEARAGLVARVGAMVIDMAVVGGIDAAIVYLTLAMTGLGNVVDLTAPAIAAPLGAFLLLLNGAYLVAFTAAAGQTIGKMLTGIKVVGEDGRRVAITAAVLRALGCLASFLTAGLGYIPALFTSDARALQDRIAGTRVVRCR